MKIDVVNMRHSEFDIRIDRHTNYGNPFKIGRDGNREEVLIKFEEWFSRQADLQCELVEEVVRIKRDEVRLGCWCAPRACHGDILKRLVEELL